MNKYFIEQDEISTHWFLCYGDPRGVAEIISEHNDKASAKKARDEATQESECRKFDEAHYAAQYAYACGYRD